MNMINAKHWRALCEARAAIARVEALASEWETNGQQGIDSDRAAYQRVHAKSLRLALSRRRS